MSGVSLVNGHVDETFSIFRQGIKNCPCCGGAAFVSVHSFWNENDEDFSEHFFGIVCSNCGVKTDQSYKTEQDATDVWNKRQNGAQKGKWVVAKRGTAFSCSSCGCLHHSGALDEIEANAILEAGAVPKFCANCGADMRGDKNDR